MSRCAVSADTSLMAAHFRVVISLPNHQEPAEGLALAGVQRLHSGPEAGNLDDPLRPLPGTLNGRLVAVQEPDKPISDVQVAPLRPLQLGVVGPALPEDGARQRIEPLAAS